MQTKMRVSIDRTEINVTREEGGVWLGWLGWTLFYGEDPFGGTVDSHDTGQY